jgi:hypothetical protein
VCSWWGARTAPSNHHAGQGKAKSFHRQIEIHGSEPKNAKKWGMGQQITHATERRYERAVLTTGQDRASLFDITHIGYSP